VTHTRSFRSVLTPLLGLLAIVAGCSEVPPPPPEAPRPVRVVKLQTIDPVKPLLISGSVKSWNEQDVSFEVAGPVDFIVRQTTKLQGRWVDQDVVISEGQELARLRDREFVIARDSANASLAVAKEELRLARTELADLLPARLRAAQANQTRADAEYQRFLKARETNAVAELDVIRHKADLDQRLAETDEARAAIESKTVEVASSEAQVDLAAASLEMAQYDLDRCTLWAPFTGEVSEVHIETGGYAQTSEPVAHLVMMDPIKVDVSVSSTRAAELHIGDPVTLYPIAGGKTSGFIYEKATTADPKTRAFRVSILSRNSRVLANVPADSPLLDLPAIDVTNRVQRLDEADKDSPYVVEERDALRKDEQGFYVWATDQLPAGEFLDRDRPVLDFRKVRVIPGDERRNFQGLYVARTLENPGPLDEEWVVARVTPKDFDGGEAIIAVRDWQLRPGQIVPTLLGGQPPKPGIYVPIPALESRQQKAGDNAYLFIEDGGVARKVEVRVIETVAELIRIEPAEGAAASLLVDGASVILDSVHFLQDGEPVRVVATRELMP
jgi:multidrug efflux pump subunit AcrA (membrane-fusion protein)